MLHFFTYLVAIEYIFGKYTGSTPTYVYHSGFPVIQNKGRERKNDVDLIVTFATDISFQESANSYKLSGSVGMGQRQSLGFLA